MTAKGIILIASAGITAVIHTLIPDHWLPFVVVSRDKQWGYKKTAWFSGFSGFLHFLISVSLGFAAYWAGTELAERIGEVIESTAAILLIIFGIFYLYWAKIERGKSVHLIHLHSENHELDHGFSKGKKMGSGYVLAALIGLHPFVLALPIIFATTNEGLITAVFVAIAYGAGTILGMIGMTLTGLLTTERIKMRFLKQYGEFISGGIVIAVGLILLLF
ncbi:MAG: hypothetical protein ACE5QV_06700 [Fidelibacterota bacterium]